MAKRPVVTSDTVVDPMFFIPEGVEELIYEDENIVEVDSEVEDSEITDDDSEIDVSGDDTDIDYEYNGSDPTDGVVPETPQIVGIIPPQIIRITDTGAEVVDVVFDVGEVYGADNYEFRVTKT